MSFESIWRLLLNLLYLFPLLLFWNSSFINENIFLPKATPPKVFKWYGRWAPDAGKINENYCRVVYYQGCRMIASDLSEKNYLAGILKTFCRCFLVFATSAMWEKLQCVIALATSI